MISMLSNVGGLSSWLSSSTSTSTAPVITLVALLFPLSIYCLYTRYQDIKAKHAKPFAFTSLPRELRDMVYTHLLVEHVYPGPRPVTPPSSSSWISMAFQKWLIRSLRYRSWVLVRPSIHAVPAPVPQPTSFSWVDPRRWIARSQPQATSSIFPVLPPLLSLTSSSSSWISSWINPQRWLARSLRPGSHATRQSTRIILANKQLHTEFMDLMCRKRTLHLTVSPENFNIPTLASSPLPTNTINTTTTPTTTPTPTTITSPSPNANENDDNMEKIWHIPASSLSQARTATLRLITTSRMLGVTDPRNMKSEEWGLARRIQRELSGMRKVGDFGLEVTAVGDPLWNPLWIWWHARRGVGDMGMDADVDVNGEDGNGNGSGNGSGSESGSESEGGEIGPRFTKITFSLDTWSPGENHLRRDAEGRWVWCCGSGHEVGKDGGRDMSIREFCARLYLECGVCRKD